MHRLVPTLIGEMGQAYPELGRAQPLIEETLQREEVQFGRTLENGLRLLDEATAGMGEGASLPGETAFKLYDTYGFPYDLTEDALRARGIGVERSGFDAAMGQQKAAARAAWKGSGQAAEGELWFDIAEREGATEFTGYASTSGEGQVVSLVVDGKEVGEAAAGADVTVMVNQTPFYGESGGQTGDAGSITTASAPTIRQRTCCTPPCAAGSAIMSPRKARSSPKTASGSTSRIRSRFQLRKSKRSRPTSTQRSGTTRRSSRG